MDLDLRAASPVQLAQGETLGNGDKPKFPYRIPFYLKPRTKGPGFEIEGMVKYYLS